MLLHFFVQEPSAEAVIDTLVPRIITNVQVEYEVFVFQGKQDLLAKLPRRLASYQYRADDWRAFILVDRDNDDCIQLKQRLERFAHQASLSTRSNAQGGTQVVNRIIVEELEAWFFGDIEAIVAAYPAVDRSLASQAAFRQPDAIRGGTAEHLERILKRDHPGGLEKIRAAQEISRHMLPDRNRSKSFQVFRDALLDLFK